MDTQTVIAKKKKTKTPSIEEQFKKQFAEFISEPLTGDYDKYTPIGPQVLVKLFKFTPDAPSEELGKQIILVPDTLNRGTLKPSTVALNEKIYPIVKVIKKGTGDWGQSSVQQSDVEVGSVYVVPRNDVVGIDANPKFLSAMNTYRGKTGSQGSLVKITDEMGIPQNLPNIDINWARYKFSMPDRFGEETEDDRLVYLISAQKLIAKYEFTEEH